MPADTIRALLIEDNEWDFVLARDMLAGTRNERFELAWASTLAQGLSHLNRERADVVVLDFTLPDSQGWDTLHAVRGAVPQVPVILLTGLNDESVGVQAVQRGAQDYLVKGEINREQLTRSIRYAIERKRSEEALRQYHDHLEELVVRRTESLAAANERLSREIAERTRTERDLRDAIERLERHDHLRSEFVSNVSHELKTPLASMSYAVDNILKGVVGPVSDELRSYIDMIREDCSRLTGTVLDILDMSRLEARTLALNCVRLPFALFVRRVVAAMALQARSKDITIAVRGDPYGNFVSCDPPKMHRVVANVVHNAVKFTQPGGRIDVELERHADRDRIALKVTDDGIGIEPQYLPRVTERYFRVGEHVSGTGLGLSIAKEIVSLHGGELHIASPPPQGHRGTQVTLLLPVVEPPTVLAVDDDQETLLVVKRQLEAAGYRVMPCRCGAEAAELLVGQPKPDILVTDLLMPHMDGIQVIARVKADPNLRRMPVLVITGAEITETQREILEGFSIPALAKPWRQDELLDCVAEAMIGKGYLSAVGQGSIDAG